MTLAVREATREDIPSLCALENECFSLPWSEESFGEFFDNDCSRVLVAEADGRICGYVGMYLILGEGEITNLAVSGEYRRCGVATALLDRLASLDGVERLLLDVRVSNTAARALYEKCGFKVDGLRRGFYSKPREDGLLMSREIEK
ncbi:MAG: ribosomal protein S18-alanine N-acetyltransferase [Clostridia bacterium]|nr:ribosomal protein S18-alanine N-acetyltransferase [Clostridia bacterium]